MTLSNLTLSASAGYSVSVTNSVGGTNSLEGQLVVDDSGPGSLHVQRDGTNLVVSWARPCAVYQLEETATLSPASWTPVSAPVQETETQSTVAIPIANEKRFYRLHH